MVGIAAPALEEMPCSLAEGFVVDKGFADLPAETGFVVGMTMGVESWLSSISGSGIVSLSESEATNNGRKSGVSGCGRVLFALVLTRPPGVPLGTFFRGALLPRGLFLCGLIFLGFLTSSRSDSDTDGLSSTSFDFS